MKRQRLQLYKLIRTLTNAWLQYLLKWRETIGAKYNENFVDSTHGLNFTDHDVFPRE